MLKEKQKQFTVAEAKIIGDRLGVDWKKYDVKQFRQGMNAELADGTYHLLTNYTTIDPIRVGKAVRTHLNESPDYYTEWAAMEKAIVLGHGRKPTTAQTKAMATADTTPA